MIAVGTDLYGIAPSADAVLALGSLSGDDAVLVKGSRVAGLRSSLPSWSPVDSSIAATSHHHPRHHHHRGLNFVALDMLDLLAATRLGTGAGAGALSAAWNSPKR